MKKSLQQLAAEHLKNLTPAQVKALFSKMVVEAEKVMAEKNPAPNLSKWPPQMPERACPWRLSDELQEIRLRVPEPSQTKTQVWKYRKPTMVSHNFWQKMPKKYELPIDNDDTLTKRRFCTEDGSSFDAWTADGKTPIFPIPMEEKNK